MIINQRDEERLTAFIEALLTFVKQESKYKAYPEKTSFNPAELIERIDGLVIPAQLEAPFVLDNEFRAFILDNFYKFMKLMLDEVDNKLFGFGERPLYEYLTTWVFLFVNTDIKLKHQNRLKALILAGHYKYIIENDSDYRTYMARKGQYLTDKDKEWLQLTGQQHKFHDYVWEVRKGVRNSYLKSDYEGFLDSQVEFSRIFSHQSMRVHANPLAVTELVNDHEIRVRHLLLLGYYARQAVDYFKSSNPKEHEKLVYLYDKFQKNNKIKLS